MLQSRFVKTPTVIEGLTGIKTLPAKLNPNLCEQLGLKEGIILESISVVITKGVGATQCRPYILHFNNNKKLFLKLSPGAKKAYQAQKFADSNIAKAMASTESFILMKPTKCIVVSEGIKANELLFFPYVSGQNLFLATEEAKDDRNKLKAIFTAVGVALADVHIACMQHANTYNAFLLSGVMQAVLVHDDWQATNLMIDSDGKAEIIDTEGTELSHKAYRNIGETWEMCGKDPELMHSFVTAYLNKFPQEVHALLAENISKELQKVGCNDILNVTTSPAKTTFKGF